MAKSDNLRKAKENKDDEFYTYMSDIENELKYYKDQFRDKIIFCNCDDPYESNFFKYFALNFNALSIKKLICTCYDDSKIIGQQLSFLDLNYDIGSNSNKAYKLVINEIKDYNKDGAIDLIDIEEIVKNKKNTLSLLKGTGDYKSEECIELLKEADIVVTNPPFSMWHDFVVTLDKYKKLFLIIGRIDCINYVDVAPLIINNKIWRGYNTVKSFKRPDGSIKKFGNVCWWTNLDVSKRHEKLILFKKYSENEYPSYYNYDGIDVERIDSIPYNYYGKMGVPVSFLEKYNPEQFKVIGTGTSVEKKYLHKTVGDEIHYIDKKTNEVMYRFPYTVPERKLGNSLRISENGIPTTSPYGRIIIQRIDIEEVDKNGNKAAWNNY